MTITKSGELVSFYTVNKAPIKHLRVYFSPKQEGEGDPSPENVREIEGWDEIGIEFGATDLVQFDSTVKRWTIPKNLLGTRVIYCAYINNQEGTQDAQLYIRFRAEDNTALQTSKSVQKIKPGNKGIIWSIFELRTDAKDLQLAVSGINISMVSERHLYIYKDKGLYANFNSTIYGGYVDLITGELVETDWGVVLDGSNDEFWAVNGTDGFYTQSPTIKPMETILYCNQYKVHRGRMSTLSMSEGEIAMNATGSAVQVFDTTHTDWRTYLNENPIQLVGQLKEPITHQLTPQQLSTLIGQNNIWSNADRVEVEYDLAESNDELYRRRNIILRGYPHIETASGNIASFQTDIAAPVKSAKVYFEPVQEGSGDPSPDNVREISGRNDVSLYHTNKGLYKCESGTINGNTAEEIDSSSTLRSLGDIIVTPNYNYTFNLISNNPKAQLCRIYMYNSLNQIVGYTGIYNRTSITTLIGTTYGTQDLKLRFTVKMSDGSDFTLTDILNTVIEVSKVSSTYSSAIPISLNWTNDIGTVYGGYVDLIKGELVQEWNSIIVDGITTNKKINSDYTDDTYIIGGLVYLEPYGLSDGHTTIYNTFCNNMPVLATNNSITVLPFVKTTNAGNQYLRFYLGLVSEHPELDTKQKRIDFCNNYFIEHPVQIVYKLQTPIRYQLTPTQLKTLKGTNNIWSNANGPIEIKYWTH